VSSLDPFVPSNLMAGDAVLETLDIMLNSWTFEVLWFVVHGPLNTKKVLCFRSTSVEIACVLYRKFECRLHLEVTSLMPFAFGRDINFWFLLDVFCLYLETVFCFV
jgi:hypothetical protein